MPGAWNLYIPGVWNLYIPGVGGLGAALLNAPRQGSALPITACQTIHNVILTSCNGSAKKKKKGCAKAQPYLFFFQSLTFTP